MKLNQFFITFIACAYFGEVFINIKKFIGHINNVYDLLYGSSI